MADFFISYNKVDYPWAVWSAWQLEDVGYTVLIQAWDFPTGSNFTLEMHQATTETQRTIVILSPDYLKAIYPQPEWAAAFSYDPTGKDRKLLPVRVRKCKPGGILKSIVYIDLVGKGEEEAREALIIGVRRRRGKPTTPPKFPGVRGKPPPLSWSGNGDTEGRAR